MDFNYSRLGSNELRLLSPVHGDNSEDLSFAVSHVSRDIAPPYTAVSYTWGDGQPTEVIYLNRRVFRVRLNLWSCLYYLSLYAKYAGWKHMWVDAICIDQTNGPERNAQVRLMDKTYRNAICVSVWLGLVSLPEEYKYLTFGPSPTRRVDSDGFEWVDTVTDLANRPYWSRFWVIQEFLLGQNVELFCSGSCINWIDFKEILCREANINPYEVYTDNALLNNAISSPGKGLYGALPIVMGRDPDRHPDYLQPLHELLVRHRQSRCKDPRDRIFALLGLIPLDDRAQLGRFFPDYTLSEEDVITIALAHLVQFSLLKITPDSEELFLGLGIELKGRRKRLLRRADFDYFDDQAPSRFSHMMAWKDELERDAVEIGGLIESEETEMIETSRPGTGRRVILISGLLLGAILWWRWKR